MAWRVRALRENYGLAKRHENPYATHLPVLIALSVLVPVENVLEFGAGQISTFGFLDRRVFPRVSTVLSYENDRDWYESIKQKVDDSRLQFRYTSQAMYTAVGKSDLSCFDLIFIDDSTTAELRSKTIVEVAARQSEIHGFVVVHDFEQLEYRRASSSFRGQFRFRGFNPEVGILWSQPDFLPSKLKQAAKIIKANAALIAPEDVEGWLRAFHGLSR